MIVGVTGSREEPTEAQKDWLAERLSLADTVHHGACQGADALAHDLAVKAGLSVVVHPPIKQDYVYQAALVPTEQVIVLPAKPYLDRDLDIAGCSHRLFALALAGTDLNTRHSGTWATVRYAKRFRRPINVCYPNGKVVTL